MISTTIQEETGRETPLESTASSASPLQALLHPMTPESFTTQYWCRRPVFIKGSPEKVEQLFPGGFGRQDFHRAVREAARKKVAGFRLLARKRHGVSGVSDHVMIEPDQMEWMLAAGANVSASSLVDERVATVAAHIKAELHHPGEIQIIGTFSTKGNGWPPHVDAVSGLLIQCQGRKRFWISAEPVAEWPRFHTIFGVDGKPTSFAKGIEPWEEIEPIDIRCLQEVVLEPGDVLFLPPGVVHATEAMSEQSLTIGLMCQPANFLNLMNRALEGMLISNPNWRHFPAINSAHAKQGELPAEAREFFAARLDELRDVINTLTPDSPELHRLWQRMIADPGESILASVPISPNAKDVMPVERYDVLCVSRKAPITYALSTDTDGEPAIDMFFANREVSVQGEWVSFLKTMMAKGRFIAGSATSWGEGLDYPWESVRECLEALIDQGILEREA